MVERQRAIGGDVIDIVDPKDAEIERLELENRRLEREASDAKLESRRAKEDANRAMSALRRQLGPLYRALQMVFGELDAAGIEDAPQTASSSQAVPEAGGAAVDTRAKAVWDSWKQRLGGNRAAAIDALLTHGKLNTSQLAVVLKMHRTSIPKVIHELKKAGIIVKTGNDFSLKQL